jgi:predicted nucleic acid-binding protein
MVYLDTSVLLPLFVPEPESGRVRRGLATIPPEDITISEWTRTEFVSAISIMVRTRRLEESLAQTAVRIFHEMAEASLQVLVPEGTDFVLAAQFLERFDLALRAGDALHLAIAANHGARQVYALDKLLIKSARRLQINAQAPP